MSGNYVFIKLNKMKRYGKQNMYNINDAEKNNEIDNM